MLIAHICRQPVLPVSVLAAMLALSVACAQKKDKQGADRSNQSPASTDGAKSGTKAPTPDPAANQTPVATDTRNPLTEEQYETLLLDLATCEIRGAHLDPRCPAKKAFAAARSKPNALKNLAGVTARLGKKHIKHPSPSVRVQAAGFLSSIFGTDPASLAVITEAARTEKEPAVLVAMIQSVGSKGGRNAEIGKLLMEMADHEAPAVRKKTMVWLGSPWNKDVPGSLEKLIERVEKDSDPGVRQFACRYSGSRGDDRMMPTYQKFTKDPEADPKLYAACMEGLMNSWVHYPMFDTHSQKAYKLSLKRLAHTPRSKTTPPWGILDNMAELAKAQNPKVAEWMQKATWYKPADVLKALEPIVIDKTAFRLARAAALKSMVALKASDKQLKRMRKSYESSTSLDDKAIIQQLDKAIAGELQVSPGPGHAGAPPAAKAVPAKAAPPKAAPPKGTTGQ